MCQEIIYKHMNGHIDITNIEFNHEGKTYKGALSIIVLEHE